MMRSINSATTSSGISRACSTISSSVIGMKRVCPRKLVLTRDHRGLSASKWTTKEADLPSLAAMARQSDLLMLQGGDDGVGVVNTARPGAAAGHLQGSPEAGIV